MRNEGLAYLFPVLRVAILGYCAISINLCLLLLRSGERFRSVTLAATLPVLCGETDLTEVVRTRLTEHLCGLI